MPDFDALKIPPAKSFDVGEWNFLVNGLKYARRLHITTDHRLGIGTGASDPKGALHIMTPSEPLGGLNAAENGLILGTAGTDSYKWIQSYGGNLSINPKGNNVGIGTENPSAPLSVVNNNKAQIEFKRGNASGAIEQNTNGGALRLQDLENKTKIQLRTYGDSYFNGGSVGIGTSNPDAKLTVDGTFRVKGITNMEGRVMMRSDVIINGPLRVDGIIRKLNIKKIEIGPWSIYQTGGGNTTSYLHIDRKSGSRVKKLFKMDWDGNITIKGNLSRNVDL